MQFQKDFYQTFILTLICIFFLGDVFAQCDEAEHSTNWEDAWLSCEISENPNAERGESHWIMYDMGDVYSLWSTKIWNYNVVEETGRGMRNCFFDLSLDGENWENWGSMEISEAPGNDDYVGIPGPNFEGMAARYLLITMESNWNGDNCTGFAEIKVDREFLGVGIDEPLSIDFELFPNPTNAVLNLKHHQIGVLNIDIYDVNANLMYTDQIRRTFSSVDVSKWASGIYVMVLTDTRGRRASKRFVVSP
jgi:hypothetical protein